MNNFSEHVIERTDLPKQLIKDVSGEYILDQTQPKVKVDLLVRILNINTTVLKHEGEANGTARKQDTPLSKKQVNCVGFESRLNATQ